ncbi:MAG: hypothetical protein V1886_00880 [archaeon]
MNCSICSAELKETFLGKIDGAIVKVNEQGKNKIVYFCPECQKKEKNLKEKAGKIK